MKVNALLLVALGLLVLWIATSKRYECFAGLSQCLLGNPNAPLNVGGGVQAIPDIPNAPKTNTNPTFPKAPNTPRLPSIEAIWANPELLGGALGNNV